MSLEHKAFIFDSDAFEKECKFILVICIEKNEVTLIKDFIEINKGEIKDPYEGNYIDDEWEEMIENKDVHQYGDFAITKYYSPTEDIGLGSEWEELSEYLISSLDIQSSPLLGYPLSDGNIEFDPGKMGSYFQSKENVINNLKLINNLIPPNRLKDSFEKFKLLLEKAFEQEMGLYITF